MATKFVAYYRVSTEKQSASGLGLEAQNAAVCQYISSIGGELVAEYRETQSGKLENNANRVELARALKHSQKVGAVLIVAKLDRLARNCTMLEQIQASGVRFVVADNPNANELTLALLMVLARNERELCSQRTKAALAAKKAKGAKLGAARDGAHKFTATDAAEARARHTEKSKQNPANVHAFALARQLADNGDSLHSIANRLNADQYTTPRGGNWTAAQVGRLLAKYQ